MALFPKAILRIRRILNKALAYGTVAPSNCSSGVEGKSFSLTLSVPTHTWSPAPCWQTWKWWVELWKRHGVTEVLTHCRNTDDLTGSSQPAPPHGKSARLGLNLQRLEMWPFLQTFLSPLGGLRGAPRGTPVDNQQLIFQVPNCFFFNCSKTWQQDLLQQVWDLYCAPVAQAGQQGDFLSCLGSIAP